MTDLQVALQEKLFYALDRYDYKVASIEHGERYIAADIDNDPEVKRVLIRLSEQGRASVRLMKPSLRGYVDTHDDKRKPLKLS